MYLHCKHGFVEADRWSGADIPGHGDVLAGVAAAGHAVVVVRSRDADTLTALCATLPRARAAGVMPRIDVLVSPPDWDYEFRVYLTAVEWAQVLARVALELDYRNFKSWTTANAPEQHRLAHDIWHAASDRARRFQWDPSGIGDH